MADELGLKLVVVGDGATGRTYLIMTFATQVYPTDYVPPVCDTYSHSTVVDHQPIKVTIWDTPANEEYSRLRPLAYPDSDIIFLCFDLSNGSSLDNVCDIWLPELEYHIPTVPRILVGCKKDLQQDPSLSQRARAFQVKNNMAAYYETSSLNNDGLDECFNTAFHYALDYNRGMESVKPKRGFFKHGAKNYQKKKGIQAPVMPPAAKAPRMNVETSTFAADWQHTLESPHHTDVRFELSGNQQLHAHRIILCSASNFWLDVFRKLDPDIIESNQLTAVTDGTSDRFIARVSAGLVSPLSSIRIESNANHMTTVIDLDSTIKPALFIHVLQFLYTGISGLMKDTADTDLAELTTMSCLFDASRLHMICQNIQNGDSVLNPSIGTLCNVETGRNIQSLFYNRKQTADVVFIVEGEHIYAHKAVLSARCDVLAAMFSGQFSETSSTNSAITEVPLYECSVECVDALFKYMYTDETVIEDVNAAVGLMMMGNQYGQTRLITLCELYISKKIERACWTSIQKADIGVISLLINSQMYNAHQLTSFCLHYISTNYMAFKKRPEFHKIVGENRKHIEEHQWPPLEYLCMVKAYEKEVKYSSERCLVM